MFIVEPTVFPTISSPRISGRSKQSSWTDCPGLASSIIQGHSGGTVGPALSGPLSHTERLAHSSQAVSRAGLGIEPRLHPNNGSELSLVLSVALNCWGYVDRGTNGFPTISLPRISGRSKQSSWTDCPGLASSIIQRHSGGTVGLH